MQPNKIERVDKINFGNLKLVECSDIQAFKEQPREFFDGKLMDKLRKSIETLGQKKPIELRLLPPKSGHKYELIDGERRWRICTELGIKIKAWIRDDIKDSKHQFLESVLANTGQESLTELERTKALRRIREDFNLTVGELADTLGKSDSWVDNYLALDNLEPEVKKMMSPKLPPGRRLTFSNALLLITLPVDKQIKTAQKVTRKRLSTLQTKELVRASGVAINKRPTDELQKFRYFLKWVLSDSEIIISRPKNYFGEMLKHRSNEEIIEMMETVEQVTENLVCIKETLGRICAVQSRKAG